jgi:hypothetical protein
MSFRNWAHSEYTEASGPQIHSFARDLTSELIGGISLPITLGAFDLLCIGADGHVDKI